MQPSKGFADCRLADADFLAGSIRSQTGAQHELARLGGAVAISHPGTEQEGAELDEGHGLAWRNAERHASCVLPVHRFFRPSSKWLPVRVILFPTWAAYTRYISAPSQYARLITLVHHICILPHGLALSAVEFLSRYLDRAPQRDGVVGEREKRREFGVHVVAGFFAGLNAGQFGLATCDAVDKSGAVNICDRGDVGVRHLVSPVCCTA